MCKICHVQSSIEILRFRNFGYKPFKMKEMVVPMAYLSVRVSCCFPLKTFPTDAILNLSIMADAEVRYP